MIDSRILMTGLLVAALLLVGQPALLAQDAAAPAKKTTADASVKKSAGPATARVEVVFRDGSTVRMETTIEIERRDQLKVTASGQIDLYPGDSEAGTYLSSPKGANMEEFIGRRGRGKGDFKPGTLVGRFGSQGKPFVIGERYSAISYETGRLYLRIIPSPFDEICSGHYKVTINVTKPSGDGPPEDKSNADAKSSARKSAKK